MHEASFVRINPQNDDLELALRMYTKENIEIRLLGMIHFAEKQFYERIENLAVNSIVVYEMAGCDYAQKIKQQAALKQLSREYQEQYANIRRLQCGYELVAHAFKLQSQSDAAFLSSAKELIHADIIANSRYSLAYETQEGVIKLIDEITIKMLALLKQNAENPAHKINEIVVDKLAKVPSLRMIVEEALKTPSKNPLEQRKNNLIKQCLQEIFKREPFAEKILVIYGAIHQPAVAEFLLELNFKLVRTEWVSAFTLRDKG